MQRIKKEIILVIAGLMLTMFFAVAAGAVPGLINYQGRLTDSGGADLASEYKLSFALYDAVAAGTALWSEEQTVRVENGIYQVSLGAVSPLSGNIFASDQLYLELAVWNTDTAAWEIMTPRQRITSVGFALQAENAETLDGYTAAELDQSAHVNDTDNPHQVTAAQIGAVTLADLTWENLSGIPVDLADGDDVGVGTITGVTAGTGLSGGGSSGDVALNIDVPLELSGSTASTLTAIVKGSNNGNGYGVYGWSDSNFGIYGYSNNSAGVSGINSSTGNEGRLGTGQAAGWFQGDVHVINGSVGIGTESPEAKLDVKNGSGSNAIYAESSGWTVQANSSTASGVSIAALSSGGDAVHAEAAGVGTALLCSTSKQAAGWFQGDVHVMNGSVGIGTESPEAKLDVKNGSGSNAIYAESSGWTVQANSSTASGVSIAALSSGGDAVHAEAAGVGTALLCSTSKQAAGWFQGDVHVMNGSVGIGTESPEASLHIANSAIENIAGKHTLYLTETNNSESPVSGFDPAEPYYGIGFRRSWNNTDFSNIKNIAGIYAYGAQGYRGGLVFKTENAVDSEKNPDVVAMVIRPDGNVGIGTTSPTTRLHVAGTITEDSDIRLKENIQTIDSALSKICRIQGVSFDWQDQDRYDDQSHLGVIAQQVEEVFPELVFTSDDEMQTKSVDYIGLIAPLVEAVKELKAQNEALKNLVCQDHPEAEICQE